MILQIIPASYVILLFNYVLVLLYDIHIIRSPSTNQFPFTMWFLLTYHAVLVYLPSDPLLLLTIFRHSVIHLL